LKFKFNSEYLQMNG